MFPSKDEIDTECNKKAKQTFYLGIPSDHRGQSGDACLQGSTFHLHLGIQTATNC